MIRENVVAATAAIGFATVGFLGWLAWLGRRAVSPPSAEQQRPVPPRLSAGQRQGARGWTVKR